MLLPIKQWMQAPSGVGIFYSTSLSFLAGIFLYSFVSFGLLVPLALLGLAVVSLLFLYIQRSKVFLIVLVVCAMFALGCLRVLLVPDASTPFVSYNKEKVTLRGVVLDDPDKRDTSLHLTIAVSEINGEKSSGLVLATLDRTTSASYGQSVTLTGSLALPKPFQTATGKEFDYAAYLRAKGIGAVMVYPKLQIDSNPGLTFFGTLYSIKHALEHSIEVSLPEPAAGLLEGILLGNKAALGNALYQIFIIAGLVHIVVLSGYNLTIVAEALMRMSSRLPSKIAFGIGATGIVLFALSVGAEATVIRASIMALIVIAGRVFKRPTVMLRALLFACVLMVLHNPLILTNDPSFILSFLAAFGLMTFAPSFEKRLVFLPQKWGVRGVVSATLATQAFVFPALIFYTGRLSLVALPSNLLALPLIPPAMLFGFLTGVFGFIHPLAALPVMIPAWGLLSLIITIAKVAAAIPGASITTGNLQTPYIFILYALLVPLSLYAYTQGNSIDKKQKRYGGRK